MAGTRSGGIKASKTNITNDPDFYRRIGSIGGKTRTAQPKGFAANPELARKAGAIGGCRSKRGVKMSEDLRKAKSKLGYAKSRVKLAEKEVEKILERESK